MRVLVTGSRDWKDKDAIWASLDALLEDWLADPSPPNGDKFFTVVNGSAKGADTMASEWAKDAARAGFPVEIDPHPAEWKKYGKQAGVIRNLDMVRTLDPDTDICLAFIYEHSKGATHCAQEAALADIQTLVLRLPVCAEHAASDLAMAKMGKGVPKDNLDFYRLIRLEQNGTPGIVLETHYITKGVYYHFDDPWGFISGPVAVQKAKGNEWVTVATGINGVRSLVYGVMFEFEE